jgi:hypothetical protein
MTVQYSQASGRVIIGARDTLKVAADSTLIVLVDRVDSVGGLPTLASLSVPLLPRSTVEDSPVPPDSVQAVLARFIETGKRENNLTRYLNTIPLIREFLR